MVFISWMLKEELQDVGPISRS